MALQGTLDTFALPEVLRLLASTRKSGRVELRGDRGVGNIWLVNGQVVAVGTDRDVDAEPEDGLFELLRSQEGSFSFLAEDEASIAGKPMTVESLLAEAEQRLVEWRELEQIVPSMHALVTLTPELPAAEVTLDADTWRRVVAVGSGLTVDELGRVLGLGEVPVCRVVRDLVTLGVGVVSAAPAFVPKPAPVAETEPVWEPAAFTPSVVADVVAEAPQATSWSYEPAAPAFGAQEPAGYAFAPRSDSDLDLPVPAEAFDAQPVEEDEDADEVARQLAMLSPRAAQAVAAAAAAGTDAEREAALAALDEDDEPVNRGLLLKFLSSVKG